MSGLNPKILDSLNQASSLELFTLKSAIERMLADPRRILAIRSLLHLGQHVRFVDWRNGELRDARVAAMKDTQVTLVDDRERREWNLPYAAIEPPAPSASTAAAPPPPPRPAHPTRNDFRCGEKVSFDDKYLHTRIGVITRINQRTATIDTDDGQNWRVGFALLRHVVDV